MPQLLKRGRNNNSFSVRLTRRLSGLHMRERRRHASGGRRTKPRAKSNDLCLSSWM